MVFVDSNKSRIWVHNRMHIHCITREVIYKYQNY